MGAARGAQYSTGWSRKASLRRCHLSRDLKVQRHLEEPKETSDRGGDASTVCLAHPDAKNPRGDPSVGQLLGIPALLLSLGRPWVGEQVSGLTVPTLTADPGWSSAWASSFSSSIRQNSFHTRSAPPDTVHSTRPPTLAYTQVKMWSCTFVCPLD